MSGIYTHISNKTLPLSFVWGWLHYLFSVSLPDTYLVPEDPYTVKLVFITCEACFLYLSTYIKKLCAHTLLNVFPIDLTSKIRAN